MKKLIIDRFEGNYAICETEDKIQVSIPIDTLPPKCEEGDSLLLNNLGEYIKDVEDKSVREERIRKKMKRLFKS